jgi:uncharacterized protein (TIGR02001 family)
MGRAWVLLGMLLSASAAPALELTGEAAFSTEWVDRGVSQTAGKPAFQLGVALAADSGVYLGAWGSNVDFGGCCDERLQFDWTLGIARPWHEITWDAGLTWSSFPGATQDLDFGEYHLGMAWGRYGFRASWTPDFANLGRELWYLEANGEFGLPWWALRLLLHAGYTHGSALHRRFADETGLQPYRDWQLALARDFDRFTVTVGWADTDLGGDFRVRDSAEHNDGRLFLEISISTALP